MNFRFNLISSRVSIFASWFFFKLGKFCLCQVVIKEVNF
jgi:hypothetical protein